MLQTNVSSVIYYFVRFFSSDEKYFTPLYFASIIQSRQQDQWFNSCLTC